jgi:hypothetical protein
MNAKCGLVEYVLSAERGSEDRFRFIILNRAPEKIARSLCEQGGLRHLESMWLWYLDPAYPKNRVDPAPYLVHGYLGRVAWYVREVEARKSVYRSMLLGGQFDVLTVTVEQPDWAETVCQAYGLSLPAGAEPILANRNKPKAERTELERRLRVLFDSIPASARADELVDGI